MAAVTRELKIDYGGFIIGLTTNRVITGKMEIEESYEVTVVTFEFGIQADTEAAFIAEIALVETAFSKPRQKLTITQGSGTIKEFDPTKASDKNTGFNADPVITKRQDIGDTGRSRIYGVTITFDMPADIAGQLARRDSRIRFEIDPSNVAKLEITGTYTAQDDKDAKEQFDDKIDAYITVIINNNKATSGADRIFQVVEKITDVDETDKILDFTIRLEEIRYPETRTISDQDDFAQQSIIIKRQRLYEGDSPMRGSGFSGPRIGKDGEIVKVTGVKRLVRLEVNYEVKLNTDHTILVQSSQQIANEYKNFYLAISRPWIIESAKALELVIVAVTNEEPEFDPAAGVLRARIQMLATEGQSADKMIIEFELTEKIHEESGNVLIPIWDGNRFARYIFQGPARRIRTTIERYRVMGHQRALKFSDLSPAPLGNWWPVSHDITTVPLILGRGDFGDADTVLNVTDIIAEKIWEWGIRKKVGSRSGRTIARVRP